MSDMTELLAILKEFSRCSLDRLVLNFLDVNVIPEKSFSQIWVLLKSDVVNNK